MSRFGQGRGGRPWRRLREQILQRDQYLCQPCRRAGKVALATEVDHIVSLADKGTDAWDNLQAICGPCHKAKSLSESKDGQKRAAVVPTFLRKPLVPVTVVCGPAGSGKTTYVAEMAKPTDLVLDMDEIVARLSGLPLHEGGKEWVQPALRERNARLGALANEPVRYTHCWLIAQAPTWSERRKWKDMLGARTVLLAVDGDRCKERIKPRGDEAKWARVVDAWWQKHSTGWDDEVLRS